ncbi:MAG: biotin--[acetyl-CoA-carboxylase] ligase [Chloroflexi bacterium]|nr:biotin--[acetyl-CoA-carboxylase] ligase [Chloroflexota bacterium]
MDRYEELHHRGMVGSVVHHFTRTTSTMDEARVGARAQRREGSGEGCGDAYVADEQTAGRGRFERTWTDAAGASLLVTFHLCVRETDKLPLVGFAGALAAADAIEAVSGLETLLKWPNDVLAGGRKLGGLLAEAQPGSTEVDVFLGIGINIAEAAIAGLTDAERALATSIEGAGALPPAVEELLAALSAQLERRVAQVESDPGRLLADWRGRLATLGTRVRLATTDGTVEGEAVDVTAEGLLVLRTDDGAQRSFAAGDVTTL